MSDSVKDAAQAIITAWKADIGKVVRYERLQADIEQALRNRDERAAKICEGLVTFSAQHEQYMPDDGSPCGWCDGLETAARAIRGDDRTNQQPPA